MGDSKKKWLGLAAVGTAIAAFVARISRRGNRETPPQEEMPPPETDS